MLGLKGATSHYACAWCKVHKVSIYDMQFDLNHYTLNQLNEPFEKSSKWLVERRTTTTVNMHHCYLLICIM